MKKKFFLGDLHDLFEKYGIKEVTLVYDTDTLVYDSDTQKPHLDIRGDDFKFEVFESELEIKIL